MFSLEEIVRMEINTMNTDITSRTGKIFFLCVSPGQGEVGGCEEVI